MSVDNRSSSGCESHSADLMVLQQLLGKLAPKLDGYCSDH